MNLPDIIKATQAKGLAGDDYMEEIWKLNLPVPDKINLSLALFDQQPTYYVLATMWLNYYSTNEVSKSLDETIYQKYLAKLSETGLDLSDSMEYSLYFDIFEDPERNEHAWAYFINKSPSEQFLKILLANSGPVPYPLKHAIYEKLLPFERFHLDIYKSIRHSCFDNCGQVDKPKALFIFRQLKLTGPMNEPEANKGFRTYPEVKSYLEGNGW